MYFISLPKRLGCILLFSNFLQMAGVSSELTTILVQNFNVFVNSLKSKKLHVCGAGTLAPKARYLKFEIGNVPKKMPMRDC